MTNEEQGKRLAELIARLGFTSQVDFAKLLNIPERTVSAAVTGTRPVLGSGSHRDRSRRVSEAIRKHLGVVLAFWSDPDMTLEASGWNGLYRDDLIAQREEAVLRLHKENTSYQTWDRSLVIKYTYIEARVHSLPDNVLVALVKTTPPPRATETFWDIKVRELMRQ